LEESLLSLKRFRTIDENSFWTENQIKIGLEIAELVESFIIAMILFVVYLRHKSKYRFSRVGGIAKLL